MKCNICCFIFINSDDMVLKIFNGKLDIFCEFICLVIFFIMIMKILKSGKMKLFGKNYIVNI